ncbi:MAG: zinc ribbon domain-containing protein [Candidatus Hermodarchaeota archaeon]
MSLVSTNPTAFSAHPEYQRLRQRQSDQWIKVNRLLDTISKAVAAKIRDIVVYYATHPEYNDYPLRVQVEDLRWSKLGSKASIGSYLAQNQVLFLYKQIQETLTHLLCEYGIGVWTVNPKYSSQFCAKCGYQGTRAKKDFTCQNANHLNAKGNPYTCDADLNASWNISLFPPTRDRPLTV